MSSAHQAWLQATPWPGVSVTRLHSARSFGRHWHDHFGVGWVLAGGQRSASGRGPVQALAGHVITHNPGEVHDGQPLQGQPRHWCMLTLPPQALPAFTPHAVAALALAQPVLDDVPLRRALQALVRRLQAWMAGDDPAALAAERALLQVLHRLLDRHADERVAVDAAPALQRAVDRLADDTLPTASLAELAVLAGCSRFQLLRRFEQRLGMPPHAWLRALRVERARSLIARGHPLAQVAAACGFADQSHLHRCFTRHTGLTPGQWRAATTSKTAAV